MKRLAMATVVLGLGLMMASTPAHAQVDPAAAAAQQNFQTFNEGLAPYGSWDNDATYGSVFYPTVQYGWRPYLYGQWAWTDAGWTWVSSEPFGWATFHYGRWWYNPYRQTWGWVPGYEYAPAWVAWRYSGAAVGWAPLYVGYDNYVPGYPVYYNHWSFVPCGNFYGGPVYSHVYPTSWVQTSFYGTTVVNGYVGSNIYGPPQGFIAAHSAVPIRAVPVIHGESPGMASMGGHWGGGAITVFHPASMPTYQQGRANPPVMRGAGAAGVGGVRSIPNAAGIHNASAYNNNNPQSRATPVGPRTNSPQAAGARSSYERPAQTQTRLPPAPIKHTPDVAAAARPAAVNTVRNAPQNRSPAPARPAQAQQAARPSNPQPSRPVVAQAEPRPNRPVASSGWNNYHSPAPTPAYHPQAIANRPSSANNSSPRRTYTPAPAAKRR